MTKQSVVPQIIRSNDAYSPGLIIKGAASQTANLQEWQNSAGTTLISIKPGSNSPTLFINDDIGNTGFPYGSVINTNWHLQETFGSGYYFRTTQNYPEWIFQAAGQPANLIIGNVYMKTGYPTLWVSSSATNVAFTTRGYTAQTANLQEWQNGSGTALASITSGGVISGGGLSVTTTTNTTNAATFYNSSNTIVFNVDTSLNAVNIGGGLSGIANNFASQWGYDSSVNAGYISFATGALGGDSLAIRRTNHIASGDYTISSLGNMRLSTASGKNFNFNNGSIGVATTSIGTNNKLIVNPYSTVDNLATVQINTNAATNKGLVVQGYTSQTANLQEWQNSSGTALVSIQSDGSFKFSDSLSGPGVFYWGGANIGGFGGGAGLGNTWNFTPYNSARVAVIVRGASSQTANLQEWQNSSGTVLSKVDSAGMLVVGNTTGTIQVTSSGTSGSYPSSGAGIELVAGSSSGTDLIQAYNRNTSSWRYLTIQSAGLLAKSVYTTNVPLTIQGIASQTADFQQWQDSNGNVLANITSTGKLRVTAEVIGTGAYLAVGSNGGSTEVVYLGYNYDYSVASGGIVFNRPVRPGSTSSVGLVIRGIASQTGDLQQWQNSSGTVLASVDKDGYLQTPRLVITNGGNIIDSAGTTPYFGFGSNQIAIYTRNAAYKGLIIQGSASQSANLQEWQNSTGTILSKIDGAGQLYVGTGIWSFGGGGYGAAIVAQAGAASVKALIAKGYTSQTANLQEWQDVSSTILAKVDAAGNFSAISKSFDIKHPTKENMRLRYASLEGPENGVYVRGTATTNVIELPDYWTGLVHEDSITVSLTSVGSAQNIYVEKIENNKVYIGGDLEKAFFTIYGERKDIDKLTVEY